jgi:HAD superfamily hydrolase (TIGR01509 family)
MQLRAILFDLWGTLILDPDHRARPRALWRAENVRAVLARHGLSLPLETVDAALVAGGAELSALHNEGRDVSSAGRVALFWAHLEGQPALPAGAAAELEAAITRMHPVHRPEPRPEAVDTLRRCRALGITTGLVSNAGYTTAPNLRMMLDEYGMAPYLDACVFSDEVGVAKPHPRIFDEALRKLGVEAPEAAFVGDSPLNDVMGARRAGLLAVQIGHKDAPPPTGYAESDGTRPNAYIDSLADLLPALTAFAAVPGLVTDR